MKKRYHLPVGLLALLGIAMIVIGAKASLIPPVLTGIGFLVICRVWYEK